MNVCLGCKSVFTSRSILGLLSHYCEKYGENCPVIRDLEELGDHSEVILEQSFVMCKCDGVSYKCQIRWSKEDTVPVLDGAKEFPSLGRYTAIEAKVIGRNMVIGIKSKKKGTRAVLTTDPLKKMRLNLLDRANKTKEEAKAQKRKAELQVIPANEDRKKPKRDVRRFTGGAKVCMVVDFDF